MSAFARVLRGGADPSLIGAVAFTTGDDRTEKAAVVALVVLGRGGREVAFGKVLDGPKGLEVLGTADLDGDGVDDLVTRSSGYEDWTFTVWLSGAGRYRAVPLGTEGCQAGVARAAEACDGRNYRL